MIEESSEQFISLDALNTCLNLENKGYIPVVEISPYYTLMPNVQEVHEMNNRMEGSPISANWMSAYPQKFQVAPAAQPQAVEYAVENKPVNQMNY